MGEAAQRGTSVRAAGRLSTRMLSGQVADLFLVRQYLDAERGGRA